MRAGICRMPVRTGRIERGHPFVDILVSADGKAGTGVTLPALIDTGFSGFVSVPLVSSAQLGLKPHTVTRYQLANGKVSEPIPLARAFACIPGDDLVPGLVSISEESTAVLVGVEFLRSCRKGLMVFSNGVVIVDEAEFRKQILRANEKES
jgi:predicted aspartyl protease